MNPFQTCFGSYDPATDILKDFPQTPGQAREDAIVMAAQKGSIPYFLRTWVEVPVAGGGMTGSIFVTPDYFAIGTDDDFVRMPMAPATAEAIGTLLDGRLPTRKMVNDIQAQAGQKLAAQPWGPPYDASMMSTGRYVAHNQKIQQQFNSKRFSLGRLTSGHKKDVVVSPNMDGAHVCIYGWFQGDAISTAIQGPVPNCKSHEESYADYSHGIRYVREVMKVGGKEMKVDDVLRDPDLSKLISDQGVFTGRTTYTDASPLPSAPPGGYGLIVGGIFFVLGYLATQAALA